MHTHLPTPRAARSRRLPRLPLGSLAGVAALGLVPCPTQSLGQENKLALRPPAVPLVTHDPYLCIWSPSTKLADSFPTHWTGKTHGMSSQVRVGGKTYRLMGNKPADVPAAEQTDLKLTATQTIYSFKAGEATLSLQFLTPVLPDDLALASRPLTYLTWSVTSPQPVQVYFDISGEWCVNKPDQSVTWTHPADASLHVLRMGAAKQKVLENRGDDLRIEWGYGFLAVPKAPGTSVCIASDAVARSSFAAGQPLPKVDDEKMPRPVEQDWPVMAATMDFGTPTTATSHTLALAYDDEYSIRYFDENLRPFWRHHGVEMHGGATSVLAEAFSSGPRGLASCQKRADAFDAELSADMTALGGPDYATLGSLCYRQAWAGNKLCADANGRALLFPKENNSNGCIATVDVIYPMAPLFLLMGPEVAKAQLVPILDYSLTSRWKFPFAAHDLGTYPHATGQVYGGGERTEDNQMPVEESGNMLLLLAAIAQADGNADFSAKYWPALTRWAEYLKAKGLDPENQLCTDDFAGHLAHNTNLSIKAILALAAYGKLAEHRGDKTTAEAYISLAKDYAKRLEEMAKDGDHYKLAFDRPDTWSQKYNLVWDRILGLNLFPQSIATTEMAYYRKQQKPYGLPLDNRSAYTKLDWITWTATLTRRREDFTHLIAPIVKMANETPDRVPLTDWYFTDTGKLKGFIARPVVGGIFLEMLYHPKVWQKWYGRGLRVPATGKPWAPIKLTNYKEGVPSAGGAMDLGKPAAVWQYTETKPTGEWTAATYDDAAWKSGPGSFGTKDTPGAVVGTPWASKEIWIRRKFDLPADVKTADLLLWLSHDDDAEIYLNGQLAVTAPDFTAGYIAKEIPPAVKATLKPTGNSIAIHCTTHRGGQNIDAGFAVKEGP